MDKDELLDQGITAGVKGDLQEAVACLEKALSDDPNFRPALQQLGKMFMRTGEFGKAIKVLTRALDLSPYVAAARVDLAYAYLYNDQLEEANREFRSVLALEPDNGKASTGLAQIYYAKQQWDKVLTETDRVLADAPANFAALLLRARTFRQLNNFEGSKDAFARAEKICSEFVHLRMAQPEGHFLLGEIFREQGNYDKAVKEYEEADNCLGKPEHYFAFNFRFSKLEVKTRLGQSYLKLGKVDKAKTVRDAILRSYPDSEEGTNLTRYIEESGNQS